MKYSVNFTPEKCKGNAEEGNVRMVVQWSGGGRVSMFVGHRVVLAKWSKDAQRCKQGTTHGKYMAARINRDIQAYDDAANKVMQSYDSPPTNAEVKSALLHILGRDEKSSEENMPRDFSTFIIEQSKLKSWGDSTVNNFRSLCGILKRDGFARYEDINSARAQERIITNFQDKGLKASTIYTYIQHINWFLRWAEAKGLIPKAVNYQPRLKTAPRKVIYLTTDELMRLYNAPFQDCQQRRLRDFYCFCCFTGLRHSDAYALTRDSINDDYISIVSKKDVDLLHIELNKFARLILERAELTDKEKAQGYALPHMTLHRVDRNIKKLAYAVGIDDPVTLVSYQGGRRVEECKPKWQCITSHTARKTFICTALSMGISPAIVMKWTGHSGYNAMKPYIDILDTAKKQAMGAFDSLGAE